MSQILVIALFVIVYAQEGLGGALLTGRLSASEVLAGSTLPLVLGWIALATFVARCARRIDATGSLRHVRRAESAAGLFRWLIVVQHAGAVLVFGLLETVRAWTGDLVLIDELIVLLVPLSGVAAQLWTMYPVERRLREAVILRQIERGRPFHPFPSRATYVIAGTKQQTLFLGLPLLLILAWGEACDRAMVWYAIADGSLIGVGLQLAGVLAILALSPPLMRRMWDTAPLPDGELLDHLQELCARHGVRVRSILIWRTRGTIVNAAVLGLLPSLRYIILTDALLELLDEREVEAVAAHEIGHVRRRHVLWLGLAALAAVLVIGTPLGILAEMGARVWQSMGEVLVGGVMVCVFAGVLGVLGLVSRRFEWQADAFAAQHLSGMTRRDRSMVVDPEAAASMSDALGRVAALNGMDPGRFTWRHGSIRARQRRLLALGGLGVGSLPIDRVSRLVKLLTLLGLGAGVALVAGEAALFGY